MRSILKVFALLGAMFAINAGARTPAPPNKLSPKVETTSSIALAGLHDAAQNNMDDATEELYQAMYARDFLQLPEDLRYRTLLAAGLIAWQDKDRQAEAHGLLVQATGYSEAESDAWLARSATAYAIGDYPDSARCITIIARRWPDVLSKIIDESIYIVDSKLAADTAQAGMQREMLQALFDAHWTDRDGTPSILWRELARLLIAQDKTVQAAAVAARISSTRIILSMNIDKRFDPVTRSNPQTFNVDRAMAAELAATQARVAAHPDQLRPLTELQAVLLDTLQFDQVLAVTDAVVANVHAGKGNAIYTDFDDRYVWILDQRARAMARLGRWDDAAEQWATATRRPEQGGMNVSQILNLGEYYADRKQPARALEMIAELGNMSDYGRMTLELIQLKVAVQQHDPSAVASHLAYMRAHQTEAIGIWQRALLISGDLNGAADLLVQRLHNEALRSAALVEMQDYAKLRMPPVEAELARRWSAVIARPQVQQALERVGRIEHFNLAPDQT